MKKTILNEYNKIKLRKLIACIMIDLIGLSSYFIPVFGEGFDIAWAPISGYLTFLLFKGSIGIAGGLGNALEEILPGTDIIPAATLTWLTKYVILHTQSLQEFIKYKKEEENILNDNLDYLKS